MGNQNGMKLLRKCNELGIDIGNGMEGKISRFIIHKGKFMSYVKPVLDNLRDKPIAGIAAITGMSEQFVSYIVFGLLRRAFYNKLDEIEFWTEDETKSILDEDEARAKRRDKREEMKGIR